MNILQYDLMEHSFEEVREVARYLQSQNFDVLVIPKDFDVLLNVDTYTLTFLKEKIEEAIRQKEIINNM